MPEPDPSVVDQNRTLAELSSGDVALTVQVLARGNIELSSSIPCNINQQQLDAADPVSTQSHVGTLQTLWDGALMSAVLASHSPGPDTIAVGQAVRFRGPVVPGDALTVKVTVKAIDVISGKIHLDCICLHQSGNAGITGAAEEPAPRDKISSPAPPLPPLEVNPSGVRLQRLIQKAGRLPPMTTAVVHPCDAASLLGALQARDAGIITPLLVGPRARIEATAMGLNAALDGVEIVDAPHSHAAADRAVALVRQGRVAALMKGKLHTDELLTAVLDPNLGLRTERRLSHVYVLDVPGETRLLYITDGAINIAPDLSALRDIVQNAIDLCRSLGVDLPRVALLSAVETVTGSLPSTLLAAAICKMHDRGQITGGLVDGPLAYDNAVSVAAALAKGITSDVAGRADVLVAPNLESGNMIAKQLIHIGGAEAAGVALGASVPIMLTSRSDTATARLASAAIARLYAEFRPVKVV
jgi:phosphate acetyltransferase/phosphate butyryltransferase